MTPPSNSSAHSTGRVAGKVAVVVGAGSGIGQATAQRLAGEGASITCADIDLAGAEATAASIRARGGAAHPAALDVVEEAQWRALLDGVAARDGRLDVLINSAGITHAADIVDTELTDLRRLNAVTIEGAFLGTKHGIRVMRDHAGSGGGSIVNVSSAAGRHAVAGAAIYCAVKAAVCMLSRAAAKECRKAGLPIRVNALCPGGVRTPLWKNLRYFRDLVAQLGSEDAAYQAVAATDGLPHSRLADPAEIAAAILYLASDESTFVTGSDFAIDDGWVA